MQDQSEPTVTYITRTEFLFSHQMSNFLYWRRFECELSYGYIGITTFYEPKNANFYRSIKILLVALFS